jgi:putative transposase
MLRSAYPPGGTLLLDVDRSAVRYRRKRKDDDADRKLLCALAAERRRFGYRRLREMACRKGNVMNLKKVYRLYREEGLMVRRRRGRKRHLARVRRFNRHAGRTRSGCSTS